MSLVTKKCYKQYINPKNLCNTGCNNTGYNKSGCNTCCECCDDERPCPPGKSIGSECKPISKVNYCSGLEFKNTRKNSKVAFDTNGAIWVNGKKVIDSKTGFISEGKSCFKDVKISGKLELTSDTGVDLSDIDKIMLRSNQNSSDPNTLHIRDPGFLYLGTKPVVLLEPGNQIGTETEPINTLYMSSTISYGSTLEFTHRDSSSTIEFNSGGGATFPGKVTFNDTIDLNSTIIMNLGDPENSQDAATKNYVDTIESNITNYVDTTFFKLDGSSTMSGDINVEQGKKIYWQDGDLVSGLEWFDENHAIICDRPDNKMYFRAFDTSNFIWETRNGGTSTTRMTLNKTDLTLNVKLNVGDNSICLNQGQHIQWTDGDLDSYIEWMDENHRIYCDRPNNKLYFRAFDTSDFIWETFSSGTATTRMSLNKTDLTVGVKLNMGDNSICLNQGQNIQWSDGNADSYIEWMDENHRIYCDRPNNKLYFRAFDTSDFIWETFSSGTATTRLSLNKTDLTVGVKLNMGDNSICLNQNQKIRWVDGSPDSCIEWSDHFHRIYCDRPNNKTHFRTYITGNFVWETFNGTIATEIMNLSASSLQIKSDTDFNSKTLSNVAVIDNTNTLTVQTSDATNNAIKLNASNSGAAITMQNAGINKLVVDTNGVSAVVPHYSLSLNANQVIMTGQDALVDWNLVETSRGSFSESGGVITVNHDGLFLVTYFVHTDPAVSGIRTWLTWSANPVQRYSQSGGNQVQNNGSYVFNMTAGQTISLVCFNFSGGNITVGGTDVMGRSTITLTKIGSKV